MLVVAERVWGVYGVPDAKRGKIKRVWLWRIGEMKLGGGMKSNENPKAGQ